MPAPQSICCVCGAPLIPDEVALTRKLIGVEITQYRCLSCLAAEFGCTTHRLQEKIEEFRRRGCVLFAPPAEQRNA